MLFRVFKSPFQPLIPTTLLSFSIKRAFGWRPLLTAALALILLYVLWRQLQLLGTSFDWASFRSQLSEPANQWRWLLVWLLMPINWLLETIKWRLLLRPFHDWSFRRCWQAVLVGVSFSAATPNRIGEIGGRLLVAEKAEVPGVLASSLLGSLVQWIVFLLIALPALLWVGAGFLGTSWQPIRWWLLGIGPLFLGLMSWYGKPLSHRLLVYLQRRWSLDTESLQVALQNIQWLLLLKATGWAGLRFCVYIIQLYCLLCVFGLVLPFWEGTAGIAAIYLIQAGIPLPPGINLLTRAELGILLWGNDPKVIAACLIAFGSLFVINVLLPALAAYVLLVRRLLLNKKTTS